MLEELFKLGKTLYEAILIKGEIIKIPFTVTENMVFDGISVCLPDKYIGKNRFTESDIGIVLFEKE